MDFVKSLWHPSEIMALVTYALATRRQQSFYAKQASLRRANDDVDRSDTMAECYHFLNKTSRSFAAVVQSLDVELRHPVRALAVAVNFMP
jgi:farnesyl-diphosphate farnesyltransferase